MPSHDKSDNPRLRVQNLLESSGWNHFAMASVTTPLSLAHYDQWIKDQQHGDMEYLKTHRPLKASLNSLLQNSQSIITVAVDYIPHPKPLKSPPLASMKVARYARGEDYHHWLQGALQETCDQLKDLFPQQEFLCYSDSKPILERDFASQLGLGWVGKNSCVIHPKRGSFFLLGEIVTSLDLGPGVLEPVPDMCGTCSRCIDACPTDAINDNRTLNATKCISYWTIESKHNPPLQLAKNFEGWAFGCDICQEVCPWNEKAHGKEIMKNKTPEKGRLIQELQWILGSSNKSINKTLAGTPLSRAGGHGLKRNALIVIQNLRLTEMVPFLESWSPERPNLIELRQQTLEVLD